jgi:hypothetical protein
MDAYDQIYKDKVRKLVEQIKGNAGMLGKWITRAGCEATVTAKEDDNPNYPLVGTIIEDDGYASFERWSIKGEYQIDQTHARDLVIRPE